ncbi:hypothetical protein [Nitrospira sp. BLG_2]|uniref:hypothetical protein n=1 Tax=Nitrospira sp. BLG_2 TaxID=3397507 RepID=UPI003B9C0EB0
MVAIRLQPVPTGNRRPGNAPDASDLEVTCEVDVPHTVDPGEYEVNFVRAEQKKNFWGRGRIFLHFRIIQPGPALNVVLFMSATLPTSGRFTLSSKFLQQWCLAAGRRPARHDRLSTKVFRDKVFLAAVRTVTTGANGEARSSELQYSVIDRLLEVRAGL